MIIIVLSHAALLSFCQPKRMTAQEVAIPMDMSSRRPIIDVTIDGKGPYKFIFDTGSSTNVLDEKLSKEFNFEVVGSDSLKTQGAGRLVSQRVAVPKVAIPRTNISIGTEMNIVNLRGMLPIDGVLSGAFFGDLLVTLDYPGSKLILAAGQLDKSQEGVVPIIPNLQQLNYNLDVAGIAVESHLDTGSPGGFSLPYYLKDKLKIKGLRKGGEIRTPVASYQPWHADLIGTIRVGEVAYENPAVVFVEGFEYANLGYSVVKDLRTTIDWKNSLIKFEKVDAAAISEQAGETNEYTGWYGGGVRRLFLEDGDLYLERGPAKLKLEQIEGELYKMVYHMPVRNELPKVRFERDDNRKVNGLTFIYADGREEFSEKDE